MNRLLDPASYADGLALAGDLVERTGVRDPHELRRAALAIEERAQTALERGAAAGLRIAASEIQDSQGG